MQFNQQSAAKVAHPTVKLSAADMVKLLDVQGREIIQLRRQVTWFQRQIFGQKSERRPPASDSIAALRSSLAQFGSMVSSTSSA